MGDNHYLFPPKIIRAKESWWIGASREELESRAKDLATKTLPKTKFVDFGTTKSPDKPRKLKK